jgi:L-lactate dehydrogenase complex protein LldE
MNVNTLITLFIPCLVDQVYPQIGIAMAKVLRHLGYKLLYNKEQTCCGQPAFNAGHRHEAGIVASKFIEVFKDSELIVCPSGSCTAMVKNYYPVLFKDLTQTTKLESIRSNIFEFSEFLDQASQIQSISGSFPGKVGFHNSCHSYRELRIDQAPIKILQKIEGIEIYQPAGEPVCCGFGGLFSFKFDAIAASMAKTRIEMFTTNDINTIISNDPGCLMHMDQEAKSRGIKIKFYHIAEFLAIAMRL